MWAKVSLEGFQVKAEELILAEHVRLLIVKGTAEETVWARVVVAFRSFILEGMVSQFVHVVAFGTVLLELIGTSWLQWQRSEGRYLKVSARYGFLRLSWQEWY